MNDAIRLPFYDKQEYLKNLRPINDLMFRLCAKSKSWCEELLRTVFDDGKLTVEENCVQYDLANPGRRSVILDAKCRLRNGCLVNIEVQTGEHGDHQRRVRFHSALLTAESSLPQMDFADIPNVCIIYICEFDIFGYNSPIYKVDRVLRGFGDVLDNGCTEIYINALARDNSKISRLMEIFVNRDAYNFEDFANISTIKHYFFNSRKGQEEMDEALENLFKGSLAQVKAEAIAQGLAQGIAQGIAQGKAQGIAEGKAQGIAEGKKEGIISVFINLVKDGLISVGEACRRAEISEEAFKAFMEKYSQEQAQIQHS